MIQRDRRLGILFYASVAMIPVAGVMAPVFPTVSAVIVISSMVWLPCIITAVLVDQWRDKRKGPLDRGAFIKPMIGTGVQSTASRPAGARRI
jgi:hypothetical protein